jgi:hypothetical protein
MNIGGRFIGAISIGFMMLNGVGNAYAFPKLTPLTISGDRGGYVIEYALRMLKLKQSRRQVEFRGSCDSACTLYLALPRSQVCLESQSSFMFHLPYGATGSGNQMAASFMMRSYPVWVRNWINAKGGLSGRPLSMSYSVASKYLPTCNHQDNQPKLRVAMSAD